MKNYTEKQIAEHRQLWLDALRSGKYKQTRYVLSVKRKEFCCLGVACEVFAEQGNKIDIKEDDNWIYYDQQEYSLPKNVKKWIGLKSNPSIHLTLHDKRKIDITLSGLNDGSNQIKPKTFKQIANILEKRFNDGSL